MKEITAYVCQDGTLHTDETKARAHDEDLLGQELDGIPTMFELDITRSQSHKALLCVLGKREQLRKCLEKITAILEFEGED